MTHDQYQLAGLAERFAHHLDVRHLREATLRPPVSRVVGVGINPRGRDVGIEIEVRLGAKFLAARPAQVELRQEREDAAPEPEEVGVDLSRHREHLRNAGQR